MSSPSRKFTRWSRDVIARIATYRTHRVLTEAGPQCRLEARRDEDDELVLIEVLDPQVASHARIEQAFREGGKAALGLRHPNVLEVLETGQCPETGLLYVVGQHPGSNTLAGLLGDDGHLQELDAVALVQQVAEGLAVAAERRLHHGSLSPDVIGLDLASTPRVWGFGLPQFGTNEDLTTARCLAPEQTSSAESPDARVDSYALGCILFRCLTGRYPYDGPTHHAIALRHANEEMPDPRADQPGLSEQVAQVVRWLTSREPAKRYGSAHALSLDLLRLLGGQRPRGPEGGKLQHPKELVELLCAIEDRRPDEVTPRGLWGTGPAYAYKVVLATQSNVLATEHFARRSVRLGRSPKCELPIDNPIVSRQHVVVRQIGAHFLVEPLSKTNPTEVNGSRIHGPVWVRPGQSFLLSGKFNGRAFWAPHQADAEITEVTEHDSKAWVSPPTVKVRRVDVETLLEQRRQEPPTPPEELPPSQGDAFLVYERGGLEVRTLLNHPFQVGRSAVCDLRLKVDGAPHKAAMILPAGDGFRLYSLVPDSTYIRLNGEPVADLALLEVGDIIEVGPTQLRFLR